MLRITLLIYHLLIAVYTLVYCIFSIVDSGFSRGKLIWLILAGGLMFLSSISLLEIKNNSYNKFFLLFNLPQIFSISILGFNYKIIFGSGILVFIQKFNDLILKIKLEYWQIDFYINEINEKDYLFIGVNIIQLFMALYFWYHLPNNEKRLKR